MIDKDKATREPLTSNGVRRSRILLAEDDDEMRALLGMALRSEGHDVTECRDGMDLLTMLELSVLSGEVPHFDLVVSDIRMPLCSGLDVLEEFFGCDGVPPVILITAFGDQLTHDEAHRLGAVKVLDKPFETDDLVAEVRRLVPNETSPDHSA